MKSLIPRLARHRILVVGDVILDEYLIGKATRMSREAPVPVLEYETRRLIPGGAANPAANVASLGSTAIQVGIVGTDDYAGQLASAMTTRGIDTSGLLPDPSRPTTVKTRIMAQMGLRFPQQLARMDRLSRQPIDDAMTEQILQTIQLHLAQADALLLSDYHVGMLSTELVQAIQKLANGHLLTADAQGELDKYRGFSVVKCNADEASHFLRRDLHSDADFARAARDLREELRLSKCMVITRGADGITLATDDKQDLHIPAPAVVDVYDTVGAGDTTIAVLTLGLAGQLTCKEAAGLANYASGLVIRRVGNYAPTPEDLEKAIDMWEISS